jgi:hypothetical protein
MTINQSTTDNPHYVTPKEAGKMICPHKPNQMSIWCEGPKCMAWRWTEINDPQLKEGQWDDAAPDNESKGWFTLGWEKRYSATHGYCGMVRT